MTPLKPSCKGDSVFSTRMLSEWLLLAIAIGLALGWSIANGMRRRNPAYKVSLRESASRLPERARQRLLRLVAPTQFKDRVNHALVIAGCSFIVYLPVALLFAVAGWSSWWSPWLIGLFGALGAAFVGEFVLNARGCEIEMPD